MKEYVGNRYTPEVVDAVAEEIKEPVQLSVKAIGDALRAYESMAKVDGNTEAILQEAAKHGYITILSGSQAHWLDEGLERACRELEGMSLREWRKENMDPSVYAYMYKKEIEEEERQKSTEVEKLLKVYRFLLCLICMKVQEQI